MRFSPALRTALLFGVSTLLVAASRFPLMPERLYSFDSVNLALSLDDFDPSRSQPQPPGYPLFVLEARLVHLFLGSPEQTFAFLEILISGLAVGMLYLLGKRMFCPWAGMTAAALLFANPAFWYYSLTSPLRLHLALVSALVAYCCWRACSGEKRYFLLASLALGLGGGFRPELLMFLFPLWAWTAWKCREARLLLKGCSLLAVAVTSWVGFLALASGMGGRILPSFSEYVFAQTQDTSMLLDASASWRRTAGRAVIWTALGTVPWFWTLPLAWKARGSWPDWAGRVGFLAVWFLPGFLFHFFVHIGDPDHALTTIAPLCVLGGACLVATERRLSWKWVPELKERGLLIWIALLGNMFLFFGQFSIPQRNADAEFRGSLSLSDAVRIGIYESSYARFRWIEQMADLGLEGIEKLRSSTERPVLVLWARDGEPVWRKICYYLPSQRVYVLEEKGDPTVSASQARLFEANQVLEQHTGTPPFRLPVPKGARLIWVIGANLVSPLNQVIPLQSSSNLYYTDLPPDAPSFRWGSFEFVPE